MPEGNETLTHEEGENSQPEIEPAEETPSVHRGEQKKSSKKQTRGKNASKKPDNPSVPAEVKEKIKNIKEELKALLCSNKEQLGYKRVKDLWNSFVDDDQNYSDSDILRLFQRCIIELRRCEGDTLRVRDFIEQMDSLLGKLNDTSVIIPFASGDPKVAFKSIFLFDSVENKELISGIIERRLEENPGLAVPWITELLVTAAQDIRGGEGKIITDYLDALAADSKWDGVLQIITEGIKEKLQEKPQVLYRLRPAWKKRLGLAEENIPIVATEPAAGAIAEEIKGLISEGEILDKIADGLLAKLLGKLGIDPTDYFVKFIIKFVAKISQEVLAVDELRKILNDSTSVVNLNWKLNRDFLEGIKKQYPQSSIMSTVVPILGKLMEQNEELVRELRERERTWKQKTGELEDKINHFIRLNEGLEGRLYQLNSILEQVNKEKEDLSEVNKQLQISLRQREEEVMRFQGRRDEADVLKDILKKCREQMVNLLSYVAHWREETGDLNMAAGTITDFFEALRKAGIEYIGIPGDQVPFDSSLHKVLDDSSETLTEGQPVAIQTPGWRIITKEKTEIVWRAEVKGITEKGGDASEQSNS